MHVVCQAQGPPGHSASHHVVPLGPYLHRTLKLTTTLLVTAPSRHSGGTRSSRAAVWISAQLDTAATSWDSLWTEKDRNRESSAMATPHRQRPGLAAALFPKGRWIWACRSRLWSLWVLSVSPDFTSSLAGLTSLPSQNLHCVIAKGETHPLCSRVILRTELENICTVIYTVPGTQRLFS